MVRDVYWYHTSTHATGPDRTFDPTARLTDETKQRFKRIGSDGRALERWAEGQKTKALHLGTYEAAIENMLRRMRNQDSAEDQFYLYTVRLSPYAVIEPGVHKEHTNWVGDVQLAGICALGVDTFRYVRKHPRATRQAFLSLSQRKRSKPYRASLFPWQSMLHTRG